MFPSGFAANAGTVAAVLGPEDVIVSDRLNHASIIDGARLSKARIAVFDHADAADADRKLAETADARRQLLITDGVFSMDGDIAPLPDLVEVAERHGAIMMVDDAHASGVLGAGGAGSVDHFGLHGRVDIQVGTLSKAIGVLGGFIAGRAHLVEWLRQRGRPYLFSTSAPPAVAAACMAALDVLADEPERLARLWSNTERFKAGLTALGFDTGSSATPITPVITGDAAATQRFARELFDAGVFAPRDRVPHRGAGQRAHPHDRDRRPRRRGPGRGARRLRNRRRLARARRITRGLDRPGRGVGGRARRPDLPLHRPRAARDHHDDRRPGDRRRRRRGLGCVRLGHVRRARPRAARTPARRRLAPESAARPRTVPGSPRCSPMAAPSPGRPR